MSQTLTLTRNPTTNTIVAASIGAVEIADLVGVLQNLQSGSLQATISANFTEILVVEGTVGPVIAPEMAVTFAPGTVSGTTRPTIAEGLPSGASFKYALKTSRITQPTVGDEAATVIGPLTTYTQGTDITVDPGMVVIIGIIDNAGGILKLTQHTLTVDEVEA